MVGIICCKSNRSQNALRSLYMCLVFPKLRPLWFAPLLDPYCRLMIVWPALSLSSLKLRMFFSASFGPILGAPNWPACILCLTISYYTSRRSRFSTIIFNFTFLPNDCKQITTEFKFWRSHKSTDWKVSWEGTPIDTATAKKLLMFSIHLKAIRLVFTFLTDPGIRVFTNLQEIEYYNVHYL